jgi:predicted RNA-binding protein YlqC (UPF0109 family)
MSSTIDQQFIEYIVKSLVSNPDAVSIERTIDEKGVLLLLTVDPQDLGRVIGKRGAGAQALRTLLRALGTKNDARYNLKIVDVNEGDRPERAPREEYQEDRQDTSEETVPAETVTEEPQEPEAEEAPSVSRNLDDIVDDEPTSRPEPGSSVDRTRQELADLDDLDI